jgi:hypothetical protein
MWRSLDHQCQLKDTALPQSVTRQKKRRQDRKQWRRRVWAGGEFLRVHSLVSSMTPLYLREPTTSDSNFHDFRKPPSWILSMHNPLIGTLTGALNYQLIRAINQQINVLLPLLPRLMWQKIKLCPLNYQLIRAINWQINVLLPLLSRLMWQK